MLDGTLFSKRLHTRFHCMYYLLSLVSFNFTSFNRILWPMSADQPINAATLTLIHKAAFELIGVRAGTEGTKPLLRFKDTGYKPLFTVEGVKKEFELMLEKIKGEEGKLVRRNFEVLSDKVGKSWDDGEESKTDLDKFLAKFID